MKGKCRKNILGTTALVLAGAVGAGAVLQSSLSVEAATVSMPGIETIVKENTGTKPFRILELVDNSQDAQIGYLASGQEPSVRLYSYAYTDEEGEHTIHFETLEEGLSRLPEKQRQEFARNVQINEDGSINEEASTGIAKVEAGTDHPLSYSDYEETYFLPEGNTGESWTNLQLTDGTGATRTDTVLINGTYRENPSGTGDYTKEEQQYYPLRAGVPEDGAQKEKYKENIESFDYNENIEEASDRPAYFPKFVEVDNAKVNAAFKNVYDLGRQSLEPEYDPEQGRFGYFENIYKSLTDEIVKNIQDKKYTFPGENPDEKALEENGAQLIVDQPDEAVKYDPAEISDSLADLNDNTESTLPESSQLPETGSDKQGNGENTPATDNGTGNVPGNSNPAAGNAAGSSEPAADTATGGSDNAGSTGTETPAADTGSSVDTPSSDTGSAADNAAGSTSGVGETTSEPSVTTEGAEAEQIQTQSAGITGMRYTAVAGKTMVLAADVDSLSAAPAAAENAGSSAAPSSQLTETTPQGSRPAETAPQSSVTPEAEKNSQTGTDQTIPDPTKGVDRTMQTPAEGTDTLQNGENGQDAASLAQTPENRQILGEIEDEETAGTQENPYIYLPQRISEHPYYKYILLGDLQYVLNNVHTDPEEDVSHTKGEISLTDGEYLYWEEDAEDNNKLVGTQLQIVTGRQQVDYDSLHSISTQLDYNYYYRVEKVYFCCMPGENTMDPASYSYYGWYYPEYPVGEDQYVRAGGTEATYYISPAQYQLTRGIGDYDFVPGGDTAEKVQVDHVYYRGGYTNNDWLKKYVFHLDDTDSDDFKNFQIQVDTRLATDVTKAVYAAATHDGGASLTEDAGETDLSSYDLICINGGLSEETAAAILQTTVPCIVGTKAYNTTVFADKFSGFLKPEDADGAYVHQYMYMFAAADSGRKLTDAGFTTVFSETEQQGFEEILTYIAQENEYRKLGEDGQNLEQLGTELSVARALEYIINYKYKRTVVTKKDINVLEITPAKDGSQITQDKVLGWLGMDTKIASVDVCCAEEKSEKHPKEYMLDHNRNTFWHTVWTGMPGSNPHTDTPHWLEVTLAEEETVHGLLYTPRIYTANGSQNGIVTEYTLVAYDKNGQEIVREKGTTDYSTADNGKNLVQKELAFSSAVQRVKKVRLYFDKSLGTNNWINASCAGIGVVYGGDDAAAGVQVHITSMTAAEFVGHRQDIVSTYDMIYISGLKLSNTEPLLTGEGDLRYSHVGSTKSLTAGSDPLKLTRLLGQLDTEYDSSFSPEGDIQIRFAPLATMQKNGGGIFRGSGNDMTAQQCDELLDFVKSGYPVVVGDELVSGGQVNTKTVDNSSYYYMFLNQALQYENVMSEGALQSKEKDIRFFANLAKPVIRFTEKPKEPQRLNESAGENTGYIHGELKYTFTLENDSDAAPAATTYDCKLYLDLNFDGNLSEKESQEKYIVIQEQGGAVVSPVNDGGTSHYELQAGKTYILTRKIPEDYYKLITWKLEIISNRNSYIHTSETGYAKQKNASGDKQVIHVLQILPENKNNNPIRWNLKDDGNFQNAIKKIEDFDIQVTTLDKNEMKKLTKAEMKNRLDQQQMLVIGFQDTYDDLPNDNQQVEAILDFVKSGKSIIFSHDTTSYINYDYNKVYKKIAATAYGEDENIPVYEDTFLTRQISNPTWGLSLNTVLRSVVGMDRYGITSDETINGETVSRLLKKGQSLSDSVTLETLQKMAGDVAYVTGSGRTESYAQTQSYTTNLLNGYTQGAGGTLTYRAEKINDGAITQYPYRMADTISLAETHGQYYQLALEQDRDINGNSDGESDVVVWYCLRDSIYEQSPNDARNNYYFYSKGNVIYTGAGHRQVTKDQEIQLFINAMVAAANVTAVQPSINFVDHLSQKADVETSRFYSTDQSSWTQGEGNVLEKDMDFYIDVKDYNMVSADLSQEDLDRQEMKLSFYIEDNEGEKIDGIDTNVKDITREIAALYSADGSEVNVSGDGTFCLTKNSAFRVHVPQIEQYLRTGGTATAAAGGYKKTCKVYVKVTSTVYLYGQPRTNSSVAELTLKQRQLFDLN